MATRKSTAPAPVGKLAEVRAEQAAARKAEAASKAAHPAGKRAPAKSAPAKTAPANTESRDTRLGEVEKVTYSATGRGGVTRTQKSATPLVAAVDVKIAGRRGAHLAAGAVVAFYVAREKAEAAAKSINDGAAGPEWTDAVVVAVAPVGEAVSA